MAARLTSIVARIIDKLQDPQLVVDFQRYCGVIAVTKPTKERFQNGATPGVSQEAFGFTDLDNNDNKQLNGVSKSSTNHKYNLRQRSTEKGANGVLPTSPSIDSLSSLSGEGSSGSDTEYPAKPKDSKEGTHKNEAHGPVVDYVITNKFLYYLFQCGACLANELFFLIFWPYWFWNVDSYVGRRMGLFWTFFMYSGQAAKDFIRWPRPSSPPVVRLEGQYALEFGMPSTHAMAGAGVPFSMLLWTIDRYEYPVAPLVIFCGLWTLLVCTCRIYLGMHSILDVIAGLAFVFCLMPIFIPLVDSMDDIAVTHPYAPLVVLPVSLALALLYPTWDKWTEGRATTTLVLGTGTGMLIGTWLNYQAGMIHRSLNPPPYKIIDPSWVWFGEIIIRMALGAVGLLATKAIMKLLTVHLISYICGYDVKEIRKPGKEKLIVEVSYKWLTYMALSVNVIFITPYIFRCVGIERATYFTEL